MKIDIVKTIIAIALSALLAYACYEICTHERVRWIITIGSFLTIGIPALLALGLAVENERHSIVLKTLSWVMLFAEMVLSFIFVWFDFSIPAYVIVNGLLLLVFALIYNAIYKK